MAETLLVTQFVGRTVARSGLKASPLATPSYHALMNIARIADNDSRELFRDMMRYNPFAEGVVRRILRAQNALLTMMTPDA
jgi:prephenate dehydrogenase